MLGLGVGTIHRAIGAGEQPAMIIGADGKYYPATSPTPEIEAGVPNGDTCFRKRGFNCGRNAFGR